MAVRFWSDWLDVDPISLTVPHCSNWFHQRFHYFGPNYNIYANAKPAKYLNLNFNLKKKNIFEYKGFPLIDKSKTPSIFTGITSLDIDLVEQALFSVKACPPAPDKSSTS